jgi:SAM-dependent methyltransferase
MPSARPPSQADSRTPLWWQHDTGRKILAEVQRMVIPELTRVFGQYGLYLRPSAELPGELSGNMLANVVSLHREERLLAGQFRCADPELPISTSSLSLVYSLFMLESSAEPEALMREFSRSLKPEGVALLISLNPWSLLRLRWFSGTGRVIGNSALERMARDAGLDVIRHQYLGPCLLRDGGSFASNRRIRWMDGFRAASLLVLRRREAGLTPLRKLSPAVSLRPGMSAG